MGRAFSLNPAPAPALAGEDYAVINTTTAKTLVESNPYVKEELWVRNVVLSSEASYDDTPFADGLTGRVDARSKNPDHSKLKKAIVEIMDTRKVRGTSVNIPTMCGIGGEGVGGEDRRQGSEADIVTGNFRVTIGKHFFSVGLKQNAIDETVIQDTWSEKVNTDLRRLHNKLKSDSIIMRMVQATTTTEGAQNLVYPNGKTVDTLKSADVIDTTFISELGEIAPGIGAMPMDTTSDSGGSVGELFLLMSSDKALVNLSSEDAMLESLKHGWDRGANNPIFKGGFTKWNGHGIYRWIHRDHSNRYAIGSPLLARAKLGVALTGTTTGSVIKGGGSMYRAGDETTTYKPLWFKFFKNSPFTFYGKVNNILKDETTTQHLMIIHPNKTSFGVYSYKVNDGNSITVVAVIDITGDSATHNWPVGSLIVQCNVLGVPTGRSLFLGAQAVACGIGSINGNPTSPEMGRRIEEKRDYGQDIGIGVEGVWGCSAVQRAGDNAYTGFLLAEHAVHVPGAPTVS